MSETELTQKPVFSPPLLRTDRAVLDVTGALLATAGMGLVVVALAPLLVMSIRFPMFVAGLALAYLGFQRLGRRRFGADFDLMLVVSCVWLTVLVAVALLAPLLPFAEHADTAKTLAASSYQSPRLFSEHPLGTNNFGLDLLARSVYGARSSLVIAVVAVLIGLVVGGGIGIIAGYFGGWVDRIVGVLTNSFLAVPALILLIALASVLPPTLPNIAGALALLTIPSMIRIARANTLALSRSEFVVAARAMGATKWNIMLRELTPNVAIPLSSLAMVMISVIIIAEASLSFLGLGIQPPSPTWGNMIAEGQGNVFKDYPFIVLVPGVFLFLTVFSFNLIGEKAQARAAGTRKGHL